jgi:pyroglutamyl-peptidase
VTTNSPTALPTVLLTGFEPFDGASTNSSWEAVSRVGGIPNLVVGRLPVEFGQASSVLASLIALHEPDLVIAVGLAENRAAITPERVAINVEDARIADNAGAQPVDSLIDADGPVAYLTRLPVKAIVAALDSAGIPSSLSDSAGTFVCNSVMYGLLASTTVPAGFIHVPSEETMDVATIARGLEIAVRVALDSLE